MFQYKDYVRPKTIDEAFELAQKKSNVVLGGMLWLKMGNNNHQTAIDLYELGLDQIEETETEFRMGAYVSLRRLEEHEGLRNLTNGAMEEALKHIVGVQFRNTATLGGSIWGRFGFSDVYTLFLALDARVVLYGAGEMALTEFATFSRQKRDILTHVIIPKRKVVEISKESEISGQNVVYITQRNLQTDFPVLTVACVRNESHYRIAVGARPALAELADLSGLEKELTAFYQSPNEEKAGELALRIADGFTFAGNLRGSAEYRKKIAGVLIRRALLLLE